MTFAQRYIVGPSAMLRVRAALVLLCLSGPIFDDNVQAQTYTSIVVFGDSHSDTGNDATVSRNPYTVNAQVPGPVTGYTDGRFTDGADTSPAAHLYNGVWIEQLAAMLTAKPAKELSRGRHQSPRPRTRLGPQTLSPLH